MNKMSWIKNFFRGKDKSLYIHVGLHKTGTTSIQLFLHSNYDAIYNECGKYYIPIPSDDVVPFQHRFLNKLMISDEASFLDVFKNNLNKCDSFIISSECFTENEEYAFQLSKLKNIFKKVYVVIYIRRQDQWIESLYKQSVMYNHKIQYTIDEWVDILMFNQYLYFNANFLKTIDRWALLFGEKNIILRSFDKSKLLFGNIVSDFCDILQIPSEKFGNHQIRANVGIKNREIIEMYRITNGYLNLEAQKELESKLFINKSENQPFISPNQARIITKHFSPINSIIEKKYNAGNSLFSDQTKGQWDSFGGMSRENKILIDEYLLRNSECPNA